VLRNRVQGGYHSQEILVMIRNVLGGLLGQGQSPGSGPVLEAESWHTTSPRSLFFLGNVS